MLRSTLKYTATSLIIAALIFGGYTYWQHQQRYPNTDDAYVQAHVIDIAAQISGKVQQVFVQNQQTVAQNQLLFTIDPKPFEIAYQKAQANLQNTLQQIQAAENTVKASQAALAQRTAQLVDAQKKYDRIMALVAKGYYSKSGGDDMTRELTVAKQAVIVAKNELAEAEAKRGKTGNENAQLQAAKAELSQALLNLQYTKVYAPQKGQLAQFTLRAGQTITAYETLFSLVDTHQWWVMANMKETNLERIHAGQKVVIYVDMYPSHPFHGVVASISPGSGSSFSLLPPENATGNWVKVTQRFPVRIDIIDVTDQFPLRIGASCSITIDTKSSHYAK